MGDVKSFTAAMRQLEKVAPAEVDGAMLRVATREALPQIRSKGSLAAKTTVQPARDAGTVHHGVEFRNDAVHANVQHWGGQTWFARSRVGDPARKASLARGNRAIKGKRFVIDAVDNDPRFDQMLLDELEALILRVL